MGGHTYGATMTASKLRWTNTELADALSPRVIGDGYPEVYTPEQLNVLIQVGLRYGRGLMKARAATAAQEQAEAFRRRSEIVWIFRGLSDQLRKRPSGQATKDAVLNRLETLGIKIDERTLMRDYKALGGAKFLRDALPFAPGEDMSSLFEDQRHRT